MDSQNPSPASLSSLTQQYTHDVRQLFYSHKLQGYRAILGLTAAFHQIPSFGRVFTHYHMWKRAQPTTNALPDILTFGLSLSARITWLFLFRDPAEFIDFKRPGRVYRWTVWATVLFTTLPNVPVHVWQLRIAFGKGGSFHIGIVQAISASLLWIALVGLVWYMALRFLLCWNGSEEDFEPISKNVGFAGHSQRRELLLNVEPYTDDIPRSPAREAVKGYLDQAYEEQRLATHETLFSQDPNSTQPLEADQSEEVRSEEPEEREQVPNDGLNAVSSTSMVDGGKPPRCQTIARFEYMSQSHRGPHSWFSHRLIPLVLSTYATVLLILLPIVIHEDRQLKFREPDP
jgi:hypothetical protein